MGLLSDKKRNLHLLHIRLHLDLNSSSAISRLCNLRQIPKPLWASVASSFKWGSIQYLKEKLCGVKEIMYLKRPAQCLSQCKVLIKHCFPSERNRVWKLTDAFVKADIGPRLLDFGSRLFWRGAQAKGGDWRVERRSQPWQGGKSGDEKAQGAQGDLSWNTWRTVLWRREFLFFFHVPLEAMHRCRSESDSHLSMREAFPKTWSYKKLESWDVMSFHTWEHSSIYEFVHSFDEHLWHNYHVPGPGNAAMNVTDEGSAPLKSRRGDKSWVTHAG